MSLRLCFASCALVSLLLAAPAPAGAEPEREVAAPSESELLFLERLMMAESGGRLLAKNLRSTALGPFQFIESTFFDVVSRHFPELAKDKSYREILQLRIDLKASRDAALAYTRENAAYLNERGITPEPAYLRLAFLLGPSGANKVISAKPETPVDELLSQAALDANPFLQGMSAEQLIERARREAAGLKPLPIRAAAARAAAASAIKVRCNLKRASCRKWLALAKKRLTAKQARK